MRRLKLVSLLALLILAGSLPAQAKPLAPPSRQSLRAHLEVECAKLKELQAMYSIADIKVHKLESIFLAIAIKHRELVDSGQKVPERLERGKRRAFEDLSEATKSADKLRDEVETQQEVVAKAEAALK